MPPSRACRTASTSCAGGVFFRRYPLAPLQIDSKTFSSSSYTVSMRTRISGNRSVRSHTPSTPDMPGQVYVEEENVARGAATSPATACSTDA